MFYGEGRRGRSLGSLGNRERKLVVEGVVEARVNPRRRDIRRGDEKLFQTVPVCTSGRFLSSGWMKSRGKLRFKLAWSQKREGEKKEGMERGISNDCCVLPPVDGCSLIPLGRNRSN